MPASVTGPARVSLPKNPYSAPGKMTTIVISHSASASRTRERVMAVDLPREDEQNHRAYRRSVTPGPGPWNRRTPNPVLLYGNFYDPATQYEFSRRMARELGNARLVTADAFGHTILGFSACADAIATAYLIELRAPRPGIVCQPDIPPFPAT